MLNKFKYLTWVSREWIKRLYIYPQNQIVPGAHFDYDSYWKKKRGEYMGGLGRWQARRAMLANKIIKEFGGKSVNDIGSGAGEVLKQTIKGIPQSVGTAYDSSLFALDIARSHGLKSVYLDINNETEFNKIEKADFTILFEILEHIPGPEELLKKSLEKSGIGVLFSFPNTGFFIHRFRLFFFGKFPLQWTKHPSEHLRFWTKKDLVWWLNAQGHRNYVIYNYVGIPILKNVWPNMFAAGLFVHLRK